MRNLARAIVPKLLGIGILVFLISRQDLGALGQTLAMASLPLVALAGGIMALAVSVKALRWQSILAHMGVTVSLRESLIASYGAFYIGLVTPGRVGEAVKAIYLQREKAVPLHRGLMSVLADRLLDVSALLVACAASALWWPELQGRLLAGASGVMLLGLVMFLVASRQIGSFVVRCCEALPELSLTRKLKTIDFAALGEVFRRSVGLSAVLWTAVSYAGVFVAGGVLARSLALECPLSLLIYAITASNLLSLLPITISGLGTRELVFIGFLGSAGVASEQALALSFLVFLCCYGLFVLLGFAVWTVAPLPLTPSSAESGKANAP